MRLVLAVAALVLGASAARAQTFGSPSHFTEQGGAAIYAAVCAACHMPDGRGASGAGAYPSLAKNARLEEAAYPAAIVLRGQKAMPPFARTLSDAQVAAVVDYIRTHFGNAYPGVTTAAMVKTARP
jgi:mono/diheme cytochrome c family protein